LKKSRHPARVHTNNHFLTDTTKHEKMAGVGGAAVPGRLWLAGTEARPTGLFSYKVELKKLNTQVILNGA
jgi:hypothetical protein